MLPESGQGCMRMGEVKIWCQSVLYLDELMV